MSSPQQLDAIEPTINMDVWLEASAYDPVSTYLGANININQPWLVPCLNHDPERTRFEHIKSCMDNLHASCYTIGLSVHVSDLRLPHAWPWEIRGHSELFIALQP